MSPPTDQLFRTIYEMTQNVALILPPTLEPSILNHFPAYECEKLYLDEELTHLYFDNLTKAKESEFRALLPLSS